MSTFPSFRKLPIISAALLGMLLPVSGESPAVENQGVILPFKEVTVAVPVDEIVREIFVKEGERVEAETLLARLADEKESLEVEHYSKLIERREFEASGFDRLFKEELASEDAAMAKATDLDLTRIAHRLAAQRLTEKSIKAPISGIVVGRHKEPGEAVTRGEALFDLVDLSKVYAQFYLDPAVTVPPNLGDKVPVRIHTMEKEGPFYGEVSFVDPRVDAASGRYRVKLLIDNADGRIKAGLRAAASFGDGAQ